MTARRRSPGALSGNLVQLDDGRVIRWPGSACPARAARRRSAGGAGRRWLRAARCGSSRRARPAIVTAGWRRRSGATTGSGCRARCWSRGWSRSRPGPARPRARPRWRPGKSAARDAGAGIWADRRFAARAADQLEDLAGSFQIVRGRVVRAAPTKQLRLSQLRRRLAQRLHPAGREPPRAQPEEGRARPRGAGGPRGRGARLCAGGRRAPDRALPSRADPGPAADARVPRRADRTIETGPASAPPIRPETQSKHGPAGSVTIETKSPAP